jgi:hypothetical protein
VRLSPARTGSFLQARDEDDVYREGKGAAHLAVDDFLDEHRVMPA